MQAMLPCALLVRIREDLARAQHVSRVRASCARNGHVPMKYLDLKTISEHIYKDTHPVIRPNFPFLSVTLNAHSVAWNSDLTDTLTLDSSRGGVTDAATAPVFSLS